MDVKARYSNGVYARKIEALNNEALNKAISAGISRAAKFKSEWQSVDINDVVGKFAPNTEPELVNGKIIFKNKETNIWVVTDVGGGYLRIQNKNLTNTKRCYLNLDGSNASNYIDKNGKVHGRSNAEYNKATHFRIKKRGEM